MFSCGTLCRDIEQRPGPESVGLAGMPAGCIIRRGRSGRLRTPLQPAYYEANQEEKNMSSRLVLNFLVAVSILFSAASAKAQMPNPYGTAISLDNAKKAAEAALAETRKNNWTMAVAIVDTNGNLVYFEKIDSTMNGSAQLAVNKARSAAIYKRPTKVFQAALAAGGDGLRILALEGAVPVEGGYPIVMDGKIVGAIGMSGGTSAQDDQCAKVGAETLK
jgi:glc operon protein GlcG